jgi:HPt (histidine-containing phosphotransfer) domain-containing protein
LAAQLLTTVFPFEVSALSIVGATAIASILALLVGRAVFVPSPLEAALVLDRRCGLQDRLTTWIAVQTGRARTGLRDYLDEDTRLAASRVSVGDAITLRPRIPRWRILALLVAVVGWEVFLAGTTLPHTPARHAVEVIRQEGKTLESAARQLSGAAQARQLPRVGETASQTEEVGRALQGERIGRGTALGQLEQLAERIEQVRREAHSQIQERIGASPSPEPETAGAQLPPNAEAVDGQAKQLRHLGEQLEGIAPSARDLARIREAMRGLQEQSRGNTSVEAQRHLQEAEDRLRQRDTAGARRAIQRAEEELRELRKLVEEEGLLQQAADRVRQSQQRIAAAPGGEAGERAARGGDQREEGTGPGDERLDGGEADARQEAAPEGPHQGRRAGAGQVPSNIGAPTDRLAAERQRQQLAGDQGIGQTFGAEVQAVGRPAQVRTQVVEISPRIVRQADETMRNARVPASYREIVRRYFLRLAEERR